MIGRKGRDLVSIPVPQLGCSAFPLRTKWLRRRRAGRGRAGPADRHRVRPRTGAGAAGDGTGSTRAGSRTDAGGTGRHDGEMNWNCRASSPRVTPMSRKTKSHVTTAFAARGPNRCGTSSGPMCRRCAGRSPRAATTRCKPRIVPIGDDKRYRSWSQRAETAGQCGHHLHDGRLGLDDRRAERDCAHRGILDRYLAAEASTKASNDATSFTTPSPRKSTRRPSITPAKAAARGSVRRTRVAGDLIERSFPGQRLEYLLLSVFRWRQLGRRQQPKPGHAREQICCRSVICSAMAKSKAPMAAASTSAAWSTNSARSTNN